MAEPQKLTEEQVRILMGVQMGTAITHLKLAHDEVIACMAVVPVHPDSLPPLVEISGNINRYLEELQKILNSYVTNVGKYPGESSE